MTSRARKERPPLPRFDSVERHAPKPKNTRPPRVRRTDPPSPSAGAPAPTALAPARKQVMRSAHVLYRALLEVRGEAIEGSDGALILDIKNKAQYVAGWVCLAYGSVAMVALYLAARVSQ